MSKNHPTDNIYSILDKLDALKPTPQEKHDSKVQQIRESVESQGSILKGLREVGSVEQRLAKQFAESKIEEKAVSQAQQKFMGMVHAAQKGSKAASPEVAKVAKSMGKKDAQDFAATKHKGLPQHVNEKYNAVKAVKQCAKDYMEMVGYTSVDQLEAEDIESIGMDCQMNYEDVCEILGCELPDSLGPVKSWDTDAQGNKFDLEEATCNECGMTEGSCEHTMSEDMSRAAKGYKKYGPEGMPALAKAGREGASEKEMDAIRKKYNRYDEGETTHTGGEKVATKTGTLHKSKATVDTERDVMTDKQSDPDKDDEESDTKEKKGRGRPKKAEKDTSQAKMPWGGKPPKDTYKHQKGSVVHKVKDTSRDPAADAAFARDEKIAKAKGRKIAEGVNFKQMDEETRRNIDELLQELQNDISQYKATGHCSETLKDFLTVHHHGKAQRMAQETAMQQPVVGAVPANLNGIGGKHVPVAPTPSHDSITTGLSDFAQNKPERGQPFGTGKPMPEEADPLEEELAKLAELAGIQMGEESPGEYINDLKQDAKSHGKHEIHAFGQDMPVGEDSHGEHINKLKQDAKSHGKHEIHAFGQDLSVDEAAKLDPVGKEDGDINNDGNKDSTDDYLKNRREKIAKNIDEAQELIAMLRVAGLDTQQIEEALALEEEKLKVSEPKDKPANAPKEKYFGMQDQLGTMNTGEGDGGEKNNYGGRGDNPMKQQPNRPARPVKVGEAATNRLEARLAAEYESIKKVS